MIASTSWEQLQQYVTALNYSRITYIHNDINSGRARYVTRRLCWRKGNTLPGSMTMMNGRPTA